jgi:hypothetical protein
MFVKGKSGNPAGRREKDFDLVQLCKSYAPDAIRRLAEIARNPRTPPATVVSAINSILDRGFGRPAQAVTNAEGGPLTLRIEWIDTVGAQSAKPVVPVVQAPRGKHPAIRDDDTPQLVRGIAQAVVFANEDSEGEN